MAKKAAYNINIDSFCSKTTNVKKVRQFNFLMNILVTFFPKLHCEKKSHSYRKFVVY
jgi:hypothetical protein